MQNDNTKKQRKTVKINGVKIVNAENVKKPQKDAEQTAESSPKA